LRSQNTYLAEHLPQNRLWLAHSFWISQFEAHGTFYPHPHMRDLKKAAKRGKILVITLVVSAGLLVLISTALIKGGKGKDEKNTGETISPAELRLGVISAVTAGKSGLAKGRNKAFVMVLQEYARFRKKELSSKPLDDSESITCIVGKDKLIVMVSPDGNLIEVTAICGKTGAKATLDSRDGSIQSSVFISHALDREDHITDS